MLVCQHVCFHSSGNWSSRDRSQSSTSPAAHTRRCVCPLLALASHPLITIPCRSTVSESRSGTRGSSPRTARATWVKFPVTGKQRPWRLTLIQQISQAWRLGFGASLTCLVRLAHRPPLRRLSPTRPWGPCPAFRGPILGAWRALGRLPHSARRGLWPSGSWRALSRLVLQGVLPFGDVGRSTSRRCSQYFLARLFQPPTHASRLAFQCPHRTL
jgi:hypothetical protein